METAEGEPREGSEGGVISYIRGFFLSLTHSHTLHRLSRDVIYDNCSRYFKRAIYNISPTHFAF